MISAFGIAARNRKAINVVAITLLKNGCLAIQIHTKKPSRWMASVTEIRNALTR